MKNSLSDADVQRIGRLVEALDRSSFDYLQINVADLRLTIGRGAPVAAASDAVDAVVAPPPAPPPATTAAKVPPPTAQHTVPQASPTRPGSSAPSDGYTVAITAPLIGIFYSRPDPNSPPFVTVGTEVDENTTVALIEVMKVFNAVPAGVSGVIAEICVEDGQMVASGQPLFRLRAARP